MSSSAKRKSKSAAVEAEEESTVWEASAAQLEARKCPSTLLLRIEEVVGVPSPTAGVVTDVYWQLDLGNKREVSGSAMITGSAEATSCTALFHEDFVVRRAAETEHLLLTLRSSALGNGCFGKVALDVEKDFAADDGQGPSSEAALETEQDASAVRVGDPGEKLVMKWVTLVPYFKSNDADIAYEMKVRVLAKIVRTPNNKAVADAAYATGVHSMGKQAMYILPDPRGTLPGLPIRSLLFLRRGAGSDKIAKGSLYIDTLGESRVLVSGKIGKRKSLFSAGAFSSESFPGASAYLDAEQGLIERDAQELLANAATKGSGSSSSPQLSRQKGVQRSPSISSLTKSPRASQRASMFFRGAPKTTEFDSETPKTFSWLIEMPVPNVNPADSTQSLPPSCSYSNDGADIFGELSKTTESAFAVRHVVNARCGLMAPFQAEYLVHALDLNATAPVDISGDSPSGGASYKLNAILNIDHSQEAHGDAQKSLEIEISSKNRPTTVQAVVHGSIAIGADGSKAHEWKAFECQWSNPTGNTLRQPLHTSVFGPPAKVSQFATNYYIEITVNGELRLPKTLLPVREILPESLQHVDQKKYAGQTLDTLHMKSHNVDASAFIAMPPVYPNERATLYSAETGEPISFQDATAAFASSSTASSSTAHRAGRSKKHKESADDAPAEPKAIKMNATTANAEIELEPPIATPKPAEETELEV